MTALLLASILFAALHLWVSGTSLRGRIVARIGEKPYLALFSLLAISVLPMERAAGRGMGRH